MNKLLIINNYFIPTIHMQSSPSSTIFENVLVRINDSWKLSIHLDTDDANAANIRSETSVEFIGKM